MDGFAGRVWLSPRSFASPRLKNDAAPDEGPCGGLWGLVGAWQASGDRVGYAFSCNEELPHDQSCELRPARFPEDVQTG